MNPFERQQAILVVEDHQEIRDLLRLQLELDGYAVLETDCGEGALELLRSREIDLVVLDAQLPGMSGYDVLAELKLDDRSTFLPVVFLSGRTSTEDVVEAFRLGAHDHVTKPFQGKELRARVAAALDVKRRHDQLRRENGVLDSLSRTDALTGLPNRRALEEDLHAMCSVARRHEQPLSVALVDVDHFKVVNDTFGHRAGDDVLRTIARRLQASLRTEDIAGRWGGEEFLLLLPLTDSIGARAVGERLRSSVGAQPIRLPDGTRIPMSISVGVATGIVAATLLEQSDAAMYRAKAAGRNLVTA